MEGGSTVAAIEPNDQTEGKDGSQSNEDTENKTVGVDQLNNNTFMPVLTEMIKTVSELKDEKAGNDHNQNKEDASMPSWMTGLHLAFSHYQSPHHDKTKYTRQAYIARLIANYPVAFEKYAHEWIVPLLKFVVKGYLFGEPINPFVHHICIILGVWGEITFNVKAKEAAPPELQHRYRHTAPPDFQEAFYNCLDYLMQHAYHPTHSIQKGKIQIIKKLFQNWGTDESVPTVSTWLNCSKERERL